MWGCLELQPNEKVKTFNVEARICVLWERYGLALKGDWEVFNWMKSAVVKTRQQRYGSDQWRKGLVEQAPVAALPASEIDAVLHHSDTDSE